MSSIKLELDGAEMMARKRLARRIVDFETIYVLSRDDRKGYLLLLALEEEQWRILESVSLDHDKNRMEEFHEMPIDKDGIEAIRLALKHWSAEKTPGRPAKYDPNREGQEIFVYHVYGGNPRSDASESEPVPQRSGDCQRRHQPDGQPAGPAAGRVGRRRQ